MRSFSFLTTVLFALCASSISGQSVLEGPDAPLLDFLYSQNSFTLDLYNPFDSNNYSEVYTEVDPLVPDPSDPAQHWRFQGYIIYQLLHDSVPLDQLQDPDLSRLVAQSDIQDSIVHLFNTIYDSLNTMCISIQMVNAQNVGSQLTYTLQNDAFSGQPFLDTETYCFLALAYASNLFRMNDDCLNDPQNYLQSKKDPNGALHPYCVQGSTLGISEANSTLGIAIYPNPTNDRINVVLDEESTIRIFDPTGKVVYTGRALGSTVIDLSSYARGIYCVEVTRFDGSRSIQLVERI